MSCRGSNSKHPWCFPWPHQFSLHSTVSIPNTAHILYSPNLNNHVKLGGDSDPAFCAHRGETLGARLPIGCLAQFLKCFPNARLLCLLHLVCTWRHPRASPAVWAGAGLTLWFSPSEVALAAWRSWRLRRRERFMAPLFYTICLTWTHSKYSGSASGMASLLQKLCNLLIDRVRKIYIWVTAEKLDVSLMGL